MKPKFRIPNTVLWSAATAAVSALLVIGLQTQRAAANASPKSEVLFTHALEDIQDREITLVNLEYPPGAAAPQHRHPAHTIVYVVSGHVESSVDDQDPIIYGPGDVWYESPMQLHATFRNPSESEPFQAIAFMLRDSTKPLTLLGSGH